MKVETSQTNNNYLISIEGSINSVTAPSLREALAELPVETADSVTINLEKTDYISSAGLREFLILQRRFSRGTLNIQGLNSTVEAVFTVTGFQDLFNIIRETPEETDYSVCSFKEFLARKVSDAGEAVILKDGSRVMTWKDLDRATDLAAEDLLGLGAKKGSHIAICGGNSLNWIITFFAIQKIGAMAVLVNPLLKPGEICFLSHVGDITILCHGIGPWLAGDPAAFLKAVTDPEQSCITALYDITRPIDTENREPSPIFKNLIGSIAVHNDDPCVMIFTSGSTGVPKGVLLSSYNLLTAAHSGRAVLTPGREDVVCMVLPLFHIFGMVGSLLLPMLSDTLMVLVPRVKPDTVLEAVEKHHCTMLFSVPTLLLGMASSPACSRATIQSLKQCVIGGAPVSEQQVLFLRKQFPETEFYIVYGLSEMSLVSITGRGDTLEHLTQTIGRPRDRIRVTIQNVETGEECPVGQTGEILIQGAFLMSGYYKTPVEKQDFDSEGWFHTGDLGFLDEEGYIHFAGRKKELIIRGGENIFPGEIAEAAAGFPGVANVQVVGLPDEYYGEIVGCALVLHPGASFSEADFRQYLKARLAPYKIPAHIGIYPEFPLLANGKVDVLTLKKDMTEKNRSKG